MCNGQWIGAGVSGGLDWCWVKWKAVEWKWDSRLTLPLGMGFKIWGKWGSGIRTLSCCVLRCSVVSGHVGL